ncbi:hypothetical protein [Dyadobacter frigoris]|uniref:hypothetical protein n=1 Tax=Dyadobacter frigoris TaxID=2576211 RepID=UPI001485C088|nr:hypothetical protein [Dyadobacter frigoris]GLU50697.1 hypothetical protein Dfri01_01580 [Dyadobacter frigoris]
MKTITSRNKIVIPEIKVDKGIPDISNDPFFLQKKQNAIEFLKQHPIPGNMLQKQK